MRHKMAFCMTTGVLLISMALLTALAERDYVLGDGVVQAPVLAALNVAAVTNPKNVNLNSATGGVIFVPPMGKIAVYLTKGDGVGVLEKNRADGRAESRLPDSGTDPLIS